MITVPLPSFSGDGTDAAKAASASIRQHCGWHVYPVLTETIILDGSGSSVLLLPTGRLIDVTACSQTYRGVTDPTVIDPVELEWSEKGYLYSLSCWTDRARGVTVTIRHGYDSVPELAELCRNVVARAAMSPGGQVTAKSMGDRSIQYAQPGGGGGRPFYDSEIAQVLAPYRINR
jgi:hypothetical protein